jgi:hypothetical protein
MKKITILLIFIFSSFLIFAQEEQINTIKSIYYELNDSIKISEEEGDGFWYPQFPEKFVVESLLGREIGLVSTTLTIYFEDRIRNEIDEGPIHNIVIRKVIIKENSNCFVYTEYVFSYGGDLIFYYRKDPYSRCEQRFYFWNDKLIKVIANEIDEEGNKINTDNIEKNYESTGKNILPADKEEAERIFMFTENYKKLLDLLYLRDY